MSDAIELRDYMSSRPELLPSFETLRVLLRPGEVAMVTSDLEEAGSYRVWLRQPNGRTFGTPAMTLNVAIANLIAKLARQGRTAA